MHEHPYVILPEACSFDGLVAYVCFCSMQSVCLTLWNENATSSVLDDVMGQVLQVTAVRVSDFNGCSLSAVTRSIMTVNPATAGESRRMAWVFSKHWWSTNTDQNKLEV